MKPSDVVFSSTVKEIQKERGSRDAYARREARGGFPVAITDDLRAFLAEVNTAFLATVSGDGQPYIQHRGGPRGFIRVVDEHTLAFVDFAGNRQYITTGNLLENDRVCLFLMDFEHRRRVKVWGHARAVPLSPELVESLFPKGYPARPEQVVVITVTAWDGNCSQHISPPEER